jgi:deazaflavin-dependent oxidoreductase (nitroreductase family)
MENAHMKAVRAPIDRGRHFSDRFIKNVLHIFSKIHSTVYRWTGGIIGKNILGNQMLLLTTIGRKTGQPRTTPVAYLTDGDAMIIVGGAGGAAKDPGWWINLQSHPEAQVQVGRRKLRVSATKAQLEEQKHLWASYPAQYTLFDSMQKRTSREIPVVILRPLSESTKRSLDSKKPVESTTIDTPVARAISSATRTMLRLGTRLLNPLILSFAGSRLLPAFAVIYHRGRRSGRAYSTPLGARPIADGFVIPLTFGKQADWFRNVQAAGGCVIRWKGSDYRLVEPEVVDWATARPAFYPLERVVIPVIGIEHFVRLRNAPRSTDLSQKQLLDPLTLR